MKYIKTLAEFNIPKLLKEFYDIEKEMSDLIMKANSLAKDGIEKFSWERYKELERLRIEKVKALYIGNKPDDMVDVIHDSILDDGNDFPKNYTAIVIASYYSYIAKQWNTVAIVNTPTHEKYLISVPTFRHVKIGTTYPSN